MLVTAVVDVSDLLIDSFMVSHYFDMKSADLSHMFILTQVACKYRRRRRPVLEGKHEHKDGPLYCVINSQVQ